MEHIKEKLAQWIFSFTFCTRGLLHPTQLVHFNQRWKL